MVVENLKKSAFSSVIWKMAERVSAQLVSLIVSVVLARILLPEDYSVVGIVTIFFAFCNILITGGLNTSLIQKKDADEADYSTVLHTTVFLSVLLYAAIFFCAPLIARIYDNPLLTPIFRVMGLTFFINGVKSVLTAYTASNLQFKKFFFSTIAGITASAGVGITMAVTGFGPWALVAQQMTNALVDTVVLFFTTKFRVKWIFSFQRLKALFQYGWKIFVTSIITVTYEQLNPLIIGMKFSATDLAFYTKGNSFPGLINSTVSDTLATVLFPVMSKVQNNTEDVLNITRRYIRVASYVMFPLMLGFFAVADNFVLVLLTEKWLSAAVYIRILCVSYMFNMIQVGNLQAIKAIGRSDITLILEIIKKTMYFLIVGGFIFFSDRPEMLAISSVVCTLVASVVNTFPNRKLIGYRYRYQFIDVLPNLLISVIMLTVVLLVGTLGLSPFLRLVLQILTGIIVYLLLSLVTKNENFKYLINYIKLMLKK